MDFSHLSAGADMAAEQDLKVRSGPASDPATTLLDVREASRTSGIPEEAIEHLVMLHIIKPVTTDPNEGPLFSVDQTVLVEILAQLDVLNFRIEEMRDMVRAVETLSAFPHTELAGRYRIRLGAFAHSLSRRAVVTDAQVRARTHITDLLLSRYTWLTP